MQSYSAARRSFSFIEGIAKLAIILGGVLAFVGGSAVSKAGLMTILAASAPGILIAMVGSFILVNIQTARATVDSAEYAQQSLKLSRDQFEISKQMLALAKPSSTPSGYATETTASDLQDVSFDTDRPATTEAIVGIDQAVSSPPNSKEVIAPTPETNRLEVDTSSVELNVEAARADPKMQAALRKRGAWS